MAEDVPTQTVHGVQDARRRIIAATYELLADDEIVNLGIGLPMAIADVAGAAQRLWIHSENGILGMAGTPTEGNVDEDYVNAGKRPITLRAGASCFGSEDAFGMIRGGHVTTAIMGAFEVDERGLVANWSIPGTTLLGVGGAMDLLSSAGRVIVAMFHRSKTGQPKLVRETRLPITSHRPADIVVTEHGLFRSTPDGLLLERQLSSVTPGELASITAARYRVGSQQGGDLA